MKTMQNNVTLMGNLGSDVKVTTLSTGRKVGRVSLATNDYFRDGEGVFQQRTTWHNLVVWNERAEYMQKHLIKGSQVIIYGKLVHRSYDDQEGHRKYISEISVRAWERAQKKAS